MKKNIKYCDPDYLAKYGWQFVFENNIIDFGYINSYKTAGDILVDKKTPDLLIFPIMFNYRQYLELLLKNIYSNNTKDEYEYEKFIKTCSHNLSQSWKIVKKFLKKDLNNKQLNDINLLIEFMNKYDPCSFNFRYPKNKKNEPSIKGGIVINTAYLKKMINKVDRYLRHTYDKS